MLQPQMLELGYGDEPAVINLNEVVAPEVGGWQLHEVAGLAIRVTEIGERQGWKATLRGSFHHIDDDGQDLWAPVESPIHDILLEWQRPYGSSLRDAVVMADGDRLRLGVRTGQFQRRDRFSNDLKVRSHDHRDRRASLTDFLRVGYRDERFGIQVMHRSLVARVAFHSLDRIAQERHATDAPESHPGLAELCEAAILPPGFDSGLSNDQVILLLKQHRRTLSKVFHPDTNGNSSEERAKAANNALDQLDKRFTTSGLPGDDIIL